MTIRRASLGAVMFIGLVLSACDSNCQGTSPRTKAACMPKVGDPTADAQGNCAAISGSRAIRVCVNHCKKVVGVGADCSNDLCADGGAVCDAHLACLPSGAGFKCAAASTGTCDPAQSAVANGCQAGTFCKRIGQGACPGLDSDPPVTLCAGWVAEGATCDSTYSSSEALDGHCWPCEPGTVCVKPSGASTGTCQRACDPANPQASCPCEGFRCIMATASTPAGSYCDQCAASQNACAVMGGGTAPCCDPSAQCNPSTGGVCCRPGGTACTASSECCGGAHGTATCAAGSCALQCAAGWADCNHNPADGCEVNLQTSTSNCGSCSHACPAGPAGGSEVCVAGACMPHCPTGLSLCGGTCLNLQSDTHNCGSCGHVCPAGPTGGSEVCMAGTCAPHCPSGLTVCGNSCINLQTSTNNCGSCGHVCPGGQPCTSGACAPNCGAWGTTCGGGVTCCAGTSCTSIKPLGLSQCCHGVAPETGLCN